MNRFINYVKKTYVLQFTVYRFCFRSNFNFLEQLLLTYVYTVILLCTLISCTDTS